MQMMNSQEKNWFLNGIVYAGAAVLMRDGVFSDASIDAVAAYLSSSVETPFELMSDDADKRQVYFLHGAISYLLRVTRERGGGKGLTDKELYAKIAHSENFSQTLDLILGRVEIQH